jgi:hypothetical protein
VEIRLHTFLSLELDGDKQPVPQSGQFALRERGLVLFDASLGLDMIVK